MDKQQFVDSIAAVQDSTGYMRYTTAGYQVIAEQYGYQAVDAIVRVDDDVVYAIPWEYEAGEWHEDLNACYRVYVELRPVWVAAVNLQRDFA